MTLYVIEYHTRMGYHVVKYKNQDDAMEMFFNCEERLNRQQSIIIEIDGGYSLLNPRNITEIHVRKKRDWE